MSLQKLFSCLIGVIFCTVFVAGIVQAESLWVDDAGESALYADHRVHAVGDIIMILISEKSSASQAGQADNSKNSKNNFDAGRGFFNFLPALSVGYVD